MYRSSTDGDERNTVLRSMGAARDPSLVKRTLGLLFSSEMKDQDVYMPVSGLRVHPGGVEALFDWMTRNWDELYKRLPPTLPMLSTMVHILTSGFSSAEQLSQVDKFFADKDTSGYEMALAQSKDSIKSKASWIQRDREDVAEWLRTKGYLK